MDIATLGVGIDPTKAVSGAATAVKAAESMAAGMNAAGKKAEAAENGVGAAAVNMGKKAKDGADTANKAANSVANNSAWSKLRSTLSGLAGGASSAFGSMGKAVLTLGAAFGALQAAMLPVMAVIGTLKAGFSVLAGAINGAADFEDYNIQWAQLIGSFDLAKQKMAELADIADKTPFDLPDIVKGSLQLQTYSNGILATREKILMIGDAAAKAKQPFANMAETMGRIYVNAKYGTEVMEQLKTALGQTIISGEAFAQLQQLAGTEANAGGKNFTKIWSIIEGEMAKAKNSMLLMSEATNGLFSTLSDGWAAFQRTIGAALNSGVRPLVRALTEEIATWTQKAKDLAPQIEAAAIAAAAFVNVLREPGGFKLALEVAVQSAMDMLSRGLEASGVVFKAWMSAVAWDFTNLIVKATEPSFWAGLKDTLYNAAVEFVQVIKTGLAEVIDKMAKSSYTAYLIPGLGALRAGLEGTSALQQRVAQERANPTPRPTVPGFVDTYKSLDKGDSPEMTQLKARLAAATAAINAKNATSTNDALLYKGGMGAVGNAGGVIDKNAVKQAKKDASELEAAAKRVIDATRTPLEAYNKTMEELGTLRSKNMIDSAQYAAASTQAATKYKDAVKALADETKQKLYEQMTPLGQLLDKWKDLGGQMKLTARDMAASVSNNMTQGFTDMITGAKSTSAAFADMAKSIVNDLARMATQMLINWAIQKAIGYAVSAVSGGAGGAAAATTTAAVHHTGGTVGQGSNFRTVPASAFTNAPKFQHGGRVGGSGEQAIIAEPGEQILNRDQKNDIQKRLGENDGKGQGTQQAVTILNVTDMSLVEQHILANPGIILNAIGQHASKVRRSLRLT